MKKALICFALLLLIKNLSAQKHAYNSAVIAFYNLENFYDTIKNPAINDEEFTPLGIRNYTSKIYWDKVEHLATVLSLIATDINPDGPAMIGVAEIENDTVLNDLIKHPLLQNRNYHFIHYDSKDARGVDVALLYNPKYLHVDTSNKLFVSIPIDSKESYFTRDVLWIQGQLLGEPISIYVNHWPSRKGGEERSAPGREAAATVNRKHIDSILQKNPQAKIIVMGDLNDDPVSPSVTKFLGAKGNWEEVHSNDLYNPWVNLYNKGIGTLAFGDTWSLFDQILISSSWLNKNQPGFFFYQQKIFNRPFLIENTGKYKGYPMRTWDGTTYRGGYSDHFPSYIILLKKKME